MGVSRHCRHLFHARTTFYCKSDFKWKGVWMCKTRSRQDLVLAAGDVCESAEVFLDPFHARTICATLVAQFDFEMEARARELLLSHS